jgi:hypothetical protein
MGIRIVTLATSSSQDLNNNAIKNVKAFTYYTKGVYPECSVEQYLFPRNSPIMQVELVGDTALRIDEDPEGPCTLILLVVQDEVGGHKITWWENLKWPGGTAPTLSTSANAIDLISIFFDGTNYYGQSALAFSVPS